MTRARSLLERKDEIMQDLDNLKCEGKLVYDWMLDLKESIATDERLLIQWISTGINEYSFEDKNEVKIDPSRLVSRKPAMVDKFVLADEIIFEIKVRAATSYRELAYLIDKMAEWGDLNGTVHEQNMRELKDIVNNTVRELDLVYRILDKHGDKEFNASLEHLKYEYKGYFNVRRSILFNN